MPLFQTIKMALAGFVLLLSGVLCWGVSDAAAQERWGFFIEPRLQSTSLLGERAMLVGGRVGYVFSSGLAVDGEVEVLRESVYRSAEPYFGDRIRHLTRVQLGVRYQGMVHRRVRYDVGVAGAVGATETMICGGTDSCVGTSGYLGLGGEMGVQFVLRDGVSLRADIGYDRSVPVDEIKGFAFGAGLRVSPMAWRR